MRNLFLVILTLALVVGTGAAQQTSTQNSNGGDAPNMGRAPKEMNGVGRLDLRVMDEQGNPVQGARAELESRRTDGFFCESYNFTNASGVAVLPPLHMGVLKLIVKAKGYQTLKMEVPHSSLNEPVRVKLVRKG